ncbi:unnamed protein product [Urochloa decumbens]|uniref:Uncharacterized protein n=1 Tax=Urochloa decumbens TaxID=240449 RepID=A0ABC9AY62_9POAL
MAAAALLRSVAKKIARAPLRPLLARGFHGGARSGPGCSLPPPTSNEGGRFVVAAAAAPAGLRSAAGLPSLATKMAPAPPPHHRLLHERGLYSRSSPNAGGSSGSTPPPAIKDLQIRLSLARAAVGVAGITLSGTLVYMYFWLLPELEDHYRRCAIKKQESELIHLLAEDAPANASLCKERQGPNQPNVATVKETSEEDEAVKAYSVMKGLGAGMKDFQADVKELEAGIKDLQADIQANIAGLKIASEWTRSKGKEKM